MPNLDKYITIPDFNKFENEAKLAAKIDIADFIEKINFNDKQKNINEKGIFK